jgi:hypothetical protein
MNQGIEGTETIQKEPWMSEIDIRLHTFHSPELNDIVAAAIKFFETTPLHTLPPAESFIGAGIYALYYRGHFPEYIRLRDTNRPIYVGKAVPPGWRTARTAETRTPDLYRRLQEHARSISQAANLDIRDFEYRFVVLPQGSLIVPIEARCIQHWLPLWNTTIDGFGNHDPGSGRYNQAPSEWDVLHPGRAWVKRLTGAATTLSEIANKLKEAF